MLRSFYLLLVLLLFSACSSSVSTTNLSQFTNADLTVFYPNNWETISVSKMQYQSNLLLAIRNPLLRDEFAFNMTILQLENVDNVQSNADLTASYERDLQSKIAYTKLAQMSYPLRELDNISAKVVVYNARLALGLPLYQFIQTYVLSKNNIYVITITTTIDENPDKYVKLLQKIRLH